MISINDSEIYIQDRLQIQRSYLLLLITCILHVRILSNGATFKIDTLTPFSAYEMFLTSQASLSSDSEQTRAERSGGDPRVGLNQRVQTSRKYVTWSHHIRRLPIRIFARPLFKDSSGSSHREPTKIKFSPHRVRSASIT